MRLPKGLSVIEHNGQVLCKLYDTMIAIIDLNRSVATLDSGTWRTKHTKKCLNLVLNEYGIHVVQRDFEWYLSYGITYNLPFHDGIQVAYKGTVTNV